MLPTHSITWKREKIGGGVKGGGDKWKGESNKNLKRGGRGRRRRLGEGEWGRMGMGMDALLGARCCCMPAGLQLHYSNYNHKLLLLLRA